MTVAEKILARASGRDAVRAGDVVEPAVDLAMSHENAALVLNQFHAVFLGTGLEPKIWDPSKIAIIFDHRVPAESPKTASNHKKVREFVAKHGITRFHDVRGDEGGICHQILPENGYVRPGAVVVGTDSHTTSHGALNAFAFGIGATEMASVWSLGVALNVEVPQTIKVEVSGRFAPHVGPKDLILHLVGLLTAQGANFRAIEFHGETIRMMSDVRAPRAVQHDGRGRRHLRHRARRRGDAFATCARSPGSRTRSPSSRRTRTPSTSAWSRSTCRRSRRRSPAPTRSTT